MARAPSSGKSSSTTRRDVLAEQGGFALCRRCMRSDTLWRVMNRPEIRGDGELAHLLFRIEAVRRELGLKPRYKRAVTASSRRRRRRGQHPAVPRARIARPRTGGRKVAAAGQPAIDDPPPPGPPSDLPPPPRGHLGDADGQVTFVAH